MTEINEMNNVAEEPIAVFNDIPKLNFEKKMMSEHPIVGNVVVAVVTGLVTAAVVAGAKIGYQAASKLWNKIKDNRNAKRAEKAKIVVGSDGTVN